MWGETLIFFKKYSPMPLKARDPTKKFLKSNKHKVHIWWQRGSSAHIFRQYTTQGIPVIVYFTILDKFVNSSGQVANPPDISRSRGHSVYKSSKNMYFVRS